MYSLRPEKDVGRVNLQTNPYVISPEEKRPPTSPLSHFRSSRPPLLCRPRRRHRRPRRRCSLARVAAAPSSLTPDPPFLVTFVPVDRRCRGDQEENIPFSCKASNLAAATASSSTGWARQRGGHELLGISHRHQRRRPRPSASPQPFRPRRRRHQPRHGGDIVRGSENKEALTAGLAPIFFAAGGPSRRRRRRRLSEATRYRPRA
jgi:hypothetical protein